MLEVENCQSKNREHRFFIISELTGAVEGLTKVKLYAVLACTACGHSILREHILDKEDAARITQKG